MKRELKVRIDAIRTRWQDSPDVEAWETIQEFISRLERSIQVGAAIEELYAEKNARLQQQIEALVREQDGLQERVDYYEGPVLQVLKTTGKSSAPHDIAAWLCLRVDELEEENAELIMERDRLKEDIERTTGDATSVYADHLKAKLVALEKDLAPSVSALARSVDVYMCEGARLSKEEIERIRARWQDSPDTEAGETIRILLAELDWRESA